MKSSALSRVARYLVAGSVALTAVSGMAQTGNPIKIGFITELTGPWAFFGTSCVAGLKMATDEINKAGGVLKRPLEFIIQDNQTNSSLALASARNLDINDKVVALSGPTSSDLSLIHI